MFLIFGHRGSPRRFRENTVASFEETLRAGADGFETDLRLLDDNTAVLYHDDEVNDVACERLAAKELVADQLEVLNQFSGRCTMILEVKRRGWEEVLIRHIGRWSDIVVASFDHTMIAELSRRKVEFPLGLTLGGRMVDVVPYAKKLGATWFFPNRHYVDRELVESLHAANIKVVPWTVNRRAQWEEFLAIGCDGVITDLPAEAVQWRAEAATLGPLHSAPREGGGQ